MAPSMAPSMSITRRRDIVSATHIVVLVTVFKCLLGAYCALFAMWKTGTLSRPLYDVANIRRLSMTAIAVSQTIALVIVALVTTLVQSFVANKSIGANQTVTSLQDNVMIWNGLGTSLSALRSSRSLGRQRWGHVAIAALFFVAASVFQIVSSSTASVAAGVTVLSTSLKATQLYIDDTSISGPQNFAFPADSNPTGALPGLWGQWPNGAGTPQGVNDTLFFKYLVDSPAMPVTYVDQNAQQLETHCVGLPASDEYLFDDSQYGFSVSFTDSGDRLRPALFFSIEVTDPTKATPQFWTLRPGTNTLYQDPPYFQFGGEKAGADSPATLIFPNYLFTLTPPDIAHPDVAVFAFVSVQFDAIPNDPSRNITGPITVPLQGNVTSWVHNSKQTQAQEEAHAFNETIDAQFFLWPMACSLTAHPGEAEIGSSDGVIGFNPFDSVVPRSPLDTSTPTNAFESNWAALINTIVLSQGLRDANNTLPQNWLEDILSPTLGLFEDITKRAGLAPNFTLANFEYKLSQVSSLAYAVYSQAWAANLSSSDAGDMFGSVEILEEVLAAHLRLNLPQLIVGFVAVIIMAGMVGLVVALSILQRRSEPSSVAGAVNVDASFPEALAMQDSPTSPVKSRVHEVDEADLGNIEASYAKGRGEDAASIYSSRPVSLHTTASIYPREERLHLANSTAAAFLTWAATRLLVLFLIYLALITLAGAQIFDRHPFQVNRVATVSEVIPLAASTISLLLLARIFYAIQGLGMPSSIHRAHNVPELVGNIRAWGGLGACLVAAFGSLRSGQAVHAELGLLLVTSITIALIYITLPAALIAVVSSNAQVKLHMSIALVAIGVVGTLILSLVTWILWKKRDKHASMILDGSVLDMLSSLRSSSKHVVGLEQLGDVNPRQESSPDSDLGDPKSLYVKSHADAKVNHEIELS